MIIKALGVRLGLLNYQNSANYTTVIVGAS